jgi:hypothetical protein
MAGTIPAAHEAAFDPLLRLDETQERRQLLTASARTRIGGVSARRHLVVYGSGAVNNSVLCSNFDGARSSGAPPEQTNFRELISDALPYATHRQANTNHAFGYGRYDRTDAALHGIALRALSIFADDGASRYQGQ